MEYESKKLKIHEKNYDLYDLELAVVIQARKMWRHYLLGKKFTFLTDHFSLKYLLSLLDLNAIQARWMAFLNEFEFDIKHMKGKETR